jgi:pimeloyl-ACP methyl ester carboxylesterase/DNA-binding winged helix-turn-helix (wHTH) protein
VIYAFDGYELDVTAHELRHAQDVIHVEPQVFDVLAHLVEHRTRVVTKQELLDTVWGTAFVSESALTSRVKAARQAVGDDGTAQRVIRTVHGRGYRFVAPVQVSAATGIAGTGDRSDGGHEPITQQIRFCGSADGTHIAYATSGRGRPLVKAANWLSHLDYDWESPVWRHWLLALSERHQLIRYDERGSGLSDWDAEDLTLGSRVADLHAVVEACGVDRFPLLGVSAGGATSVAYAARYPERVSHLMLYGAFARGRMARATSVAGKREAELMVELASLGWGRDDPAFRRVFTMQFMPESSAEMWAAFDELQRRTTSPENAARLMAAAGDLDVVDLATTLRVPTLVLHARGDRRVPLDEGRQLASLIPDARMVVLDGPNHILQEQEPAWRRFLDEVNSFLDSS